MNCLDICTFSSDVIAFFPADKELMSLTTIISYLRFVRHRPFIPSHPLIGFLGIVSDPIYDDIAGEIASAYFTEQILCAN